jgi:hypothetical protein
MTVDVPEKLNGSIGGAGRAGFSRRSEASYESRSAPVSVCEAVARHRRQMRRDGAPPDVLSESGLPDTPDAGLTDTPDVDLPDEPAAVRLPRTEGYTRFGQRSDPRGDADAPARTQRGTTYSRKFAEPPVERRDTSGDTEPQKFPQPEYPAESLSRTDAPAEPARTEQHGASEQLGDVGASVREALSNLERPERPFDSRPGRLRFGAEEKTPAADAAPSDKKLTRARSKAEQSSEKLVNAREKLPTKRRVRSHQIFDEKKGKPRREIYFKKGIKTQREHLKGSVVTRPVKAAGNAAVAYGHRKLYQAEHENAAVKATHRGSLWPRPGFGGCTGITRPRHTARPGD